MFLFKEPCYCKNLTDANGYGNCQASETRWYIGEIFGTSRIPAGCYVQLPSGCPDLKDSDMIPGEKTSEEACIISEGTIILRL